MRTAGELRRPKNGIAKRAIYRIRVLVREETSMVECPVCEGKIDVDEVDVDEATPSVVMNVARP